MKKGYYFSMDALLALSLLGIGILLLSQLYSAQAPVQQLSYYSKDVITLVSTTPLEGFNNSFVQELIADGVINDTNKTIIEQIGILWVTGREDLARLLAENISHAAIPDNYGFSFVIGNDTIYERPKPNSTNVVVFKSMITGIEKEHPLQGTAARIFLSDSFEHSRTIYSYFGGFVGQGNITLQLRNIPHDADFISGYLELDAASNFTLYVDQTSCAYFAVNNTNMSSQAWNITNCTTFINNGTTTNISIVFDDDLTNAYVGGGFFKTVFTTKEVFFTNLTEKQYYFPGIEGIINLYDAFSIPGEIMSIDMYLHYIARNTLGGNSTLYLTIGNATIYIDNQTTGVVELAISNESIASNLSVAGLPYQMLSNATIPLRFGFYNLSTEGSAYSIDDSGDAVLITDRSGSMAWQLTSTAGGNNHNDMDCDQALTQADITRRRVANCTNTLFIENMTQGSGNRVGLVTYAASTNVDGQHELSTDTASLLDANAYVMNTGGGTCLGCGIDSSINTLLDNWWYLIPYRDNNWKYTIEKQENLSWTNNTYDDSGWTWGTAALGYGGGEDTTVPEEDDPGIPFIYDDFESNSGWQRNRLGTDTASSGRWIRGNPVGYTIDSDNPSQPEDDHTAGGTNCFITGLSGGYTGTGTNGDVDGGFTTLESPIYDFSGNEGVTITYWRHYASNNNPALDDYFEFAISDDGGSSYTVIDRIEGDAGHNNWHFVSFHLTEDTITFTNNMRLRFRASDHGNGDVVEAGIDDLEIIGNKTFNDLYLRTTFTVDNINLLKNPMLHMLTDDKAEVYLNGRLLFNDSLTHTGEYWDLMMSIYEPLFYAEDFNRANDASVGNGWTETVGTSWQTIGNKARARNCGAQSTMEYVFDLSQEDNAHLRFDWMMEANNANECLEAELDCVGGGCVTTTVSICDRSMDASTEEINLSTYLGHDDVRLSFTCEYIDGSPEFIFIDNIELFRKMSDVLNVGENVMAVKVYNDDNNLLFDTEIIATERSKAILAMTDGEPNSCVTLGTGSGYDPVSACNCWGALSQQESCPDLISIEGDLGDGIDEASEQAIGLSCYMHDYYGVDVYAVLMGNSVGVPTMQEIACCGGNCSRFYQSDDAEEIQNIYAGILSGMIDGFLGFYESQQIDVLTLINFSYSVLYPDSYINITYQPYVADIAHGEIPVFFELEPTSECLFMFQHPEGVRLLDAQVTSYSGEHWTDYLHVDNMFDTSTVFNLSDYHMGYKYLGDPFLLPIPVQYIGESNNFITLNTGDGPDNATGCSDNNTLMYTGLVNVINHSLPYSAVLPNASGCSWIIDLESGVNISLKVPLDYDGAATCFYTSDVHDTAGHNEEDAYDAAMYTLLTFLDYDMDGRIFIQFDETDLLIDSETIGDVPYLWGPTIAEVLVWQ